MGEWAKNIQAFWYGANGLEFVAWKGSHQIQVYPCDEYPSPAKYTIQHHTRIETVEEFNDCLMNGQRMKASYEAIEDFMI